MGRNVSFYLNNYSTFLQTRLEMSKQYDSPLFSLSVLGFISHTQHADLHQVRQDVD